MSNTTCNRLYGKVILTATLTLRSGLHIGTAGDFSAIGAVDNIVVRDPISHRPIIPGSSLKGKMRYLLTMAEYFEVDIKTTEMKERYQEILRLFGGSKPVIMRSRLQFFDAHLQEESAKHLLSLDLDLPYTEIKFENSIDYATSIANPRQQERVPAGAKFDFTLCYNVENLEELDKDLCNITRILSYLEDDYLGGHGSRGYGRVSFSDIKTQIKNYSGEAEVESKLKEWESSLMNGVN